MFFPNLSQKAVRNAYTHTTVSHLLAQIVSDVIVLFLEVDGSSKVRTPQSTEHALITLFIFLALAVQLSHTQ